jgi:uncharacterized membrane protein
MHRPRSEAWVTVGTLLLLAALALPLACGDDDSSDLDANGCVRGAPCDGSFTGPRSPGGSHSDGSRWGLGGQGGKGGKGGTGGMLRPPSIDGAGFLGGRGGHKSDQQDAGPADASAPLDDAGEADSGS